MKSKMQALARPKLFPDAGEPDVPLPKQQVSRSGLMPASASPLARRTWRRDRRAAWRKLEQAEVMTHSLKGPGCASSKEFRYRVTVADEAKLALHVVKLGARIDA